MVTVCVMLLWLAPAALVPPRAVFALADTPAPCVHWPSAGTAQPVIIETWSQETLVDMLPLLCQAGCIDLRGERGK